MHTYYDDDAGKVDWNGIESAASFIGDYCRKWGRICVMQTKEKYGTARVYTSFGWTSLHSLVYPGYCYSQFPNWLWNMDCDYIGPVIRCLIEPWFIKWQYFIYRRAYRLAIKKWPHLFEEITRCMDFQKLLPEAEHYWRGWKIGEKYGKIRGEKRVVEIAKEIKCCPGGAQVLEKKVSE